MSVRPERAQLDDLLRAREAKGLRVPLLGRILVLSYGLVNVVASVGFAIGAGVSYNQARKGYDRAVDIYNESFGMRLGILDGNGEYRPPPGVMVDDEGFVILTDVETGPPKRVIFLPEGPLPPPLAVDPESGAPTTLDAETISAGLTGAREAAERECRPLATAGDDEGWRRRLHRARNLGVGRLVVAPGEGERLRSPDAMDDGQRLLQGILPFAR